MHSRATLGGNRLFDEKRALLAGKPTEEMLGTLVHKSPPEVGKADQVARHVCAAARVSDGLHTVSPQLKNRTNG